MDNTLLGIMLVLGIPHILFIIIPVRTTLNSSISVFSKSLWCVFLVFLPLIGAALFHYRFRSGLFQGQQYEVSAAEERARSGTFSPDDYD